MFSKVRFKLIPTAIFIASGANFGAFYRSELVIRYTSLLLIVAVEYC